MRFHNRDDAGRRLAAAVSDRLPDASGVVVAAGLPRGGVPVARHVADTLGEPLDVLCVRKLGLPSQPEYAMGAIGEGDVCVLDRAVVARAGVSDAAIGDIVRQERTELLRRADRYRGQRPPLSLTDRIAIIIDDGLATGNTARAMVARRVVLAVPVAPTGTVTALRELADDVIALSTPTRFTSVGEWYDNFEPTSDAEVIAALVGTDPLTPEADRTELGGFTATLRLPIDGIRLEGIVEVPEQAHGVVVFAHGSGSSRHSVRNRAVARRLRQAGFATVLFDLLTEAEAGDRSLVFDTESLSRRLLHVTQWLQTDFGALCMPPGMTSAPKSGWLEGSLGGCAKVRGGRGKSGWLEGRARQGCLASCRDWRSRHRASTWVTRWSWPVELSMR